MASGNLFRKLRIAVLLYVLLFVAVSSWLSEAATTDWDDTLFVTLYPVNGDGTALVADYLARLEKSEFLSIERFMQREVTRYGRSILQPVAITLGPTLATGPPGPGADPNTLEIMAWSLRLRWWAWRATRDDGLPTPDIRLFVSYFTPDDGLVLDSSVGLQKGLVGIINAFADPTLAGSNNVVITHELLHTLGATDKYDPATTQPIFPVGYAEPDRTPRYPQRQAEIMAGRIPVSPGQTQMPESLSRVVVGPTTAAEIRLREPTR